MNRTKCQHLFETGKNKGKACGKDGAYNIQYHINLDYCRAHADKYSAENDKKCIEHYTQEQEKARKIREAKPKREERKFTRDNYGHFIKQLESDFEIGEQDGRTVEQVVDDLLTNSAPVLRANRMYSMIVMPNQFGGYSFEEMIREFEVRGFEAYDTRRTELERSDTRKNSKDGKDWICLDTKCYTIG